MLTSVRIPFVIQLPLNAYPSFSLIDGSSINHNFSVEFEHLKIKRSMKIVVKNNPNFTNINKLLKIPFQFTKIVSKSKFLFNKGNFTINVNLPKNVFYYDEPIPYEINLNCKELDLIIKQINISLIRHIKKNYSKNIFQKIELISESKKLNKDVKEYCFKNEMKFPNYLNNNITSLIYPPLVYNIIEKKGPYGEDITDVKFLNNLYPSCMGGMISIEYYITIKLLFDSSLTSDESYDIPIDFCSRHEEINNNNNFGQIGVFNPVNINNYNNNNNNASNNIIHNQFLNPYENNNIRENKNENENIFNNNITLENNNISNNNQNINNIDYVAPPPSLDNNFININAL